MRVEGGEQPHRRGVGTTGPHGLYTGAFRRDTDVLRTGAHRNLAGGLGSSLHVGGHPEGSTVVPGCGLFPLLFVPRLLQCYLSNSRLDSDAAHEPAWVKRGIGIELLLYLPHQPQPFAHVTPNVYPAAYLSRRSPDD